MSGDPTPATAAALGRVLEFACRAQPNLTLTELRTLLAVAREEGMSVLSVARVCGFTGATASRTLRGLASPAALKPGRGFVVLMRGPAEERSRFAFLTPAGRAFCEDLARSLVDDPTSRPTGNPDQEVSADFDERILATS